MRRSSIAPGDVLRRYFGKRGGAVVDANLEVIREAYDSLIDVTSAIRRGQHRGHQEVLG